jgi:hypothetical protein
LEFKENATLLKSRRTEQIEFWFRHRSNHTSNKRFLREFCDFQVRDMREWMNILELSIKTRCSARAPKDR